MRTPIVKRKRSWFHSPVVAVVLVLLVIWGMVGVVRAYFKQHDAAEFRNQYAREYRDLETKHQELEGKISDLSTERGMEEEIRNRYRVSRPGERLVVVVDNGTDQEVAKKPGFWARLRQFVGL